MIKVIKDWIHRYFSDPEAIILIALVISSFTGVMLFGNILAPVLASIVIAYLLQWWVSLLENNNVPRLAAVSFVYVGFITIFASLLLILMPLLWKQLMALFTELPGMLQSAKKILMQFFDAYPAYFSQQQLDTLTSSIIKDIQNWGKAALSASIYSIPGIIAWLVYLVLVPILVFFFLKDSSKISLWLQRFLPNKRPVLQKVAQEMDSQIGNYVRGKITEIVIVGIATYIIFLIFKLRYATLLASLVGLSVIIPYIGATVVTLPVALVAYLQWGWGNEFAYLMLSYLVIQAIDGNVIVPLLFSEAVNLHPVAIIISILIFGALWGFWGVFFAIPLATLFKAIINSWPKKQH